MSQETINKSTLRWQCITIMLVLSPLTTMSHHHPYTFPTTNSTVLPSPYTFFSPKLTPPLPTNSFFQNFVLEKGDQPEYIHPYLIKSRNSSLSISYPSLFSNSSIIYQRFKRDLTISVLNNSKKRAHVISSYDDLSVTLDIQGGLRFLLVRGSPFLTCEVLNKVVLSISTIRVIVGFVPNSAKTKYKISLSNGQTWVLYASSAIELSHGVNRIVSGEFRGVIRIAVLGSGLGFESVLDRFSTCYPVSGLAVFSEPFRVKYKWEKKGWGDLLMLANPLHIKLIDDSSVSKVNGFKYGSIDGELVGVVGDSWVLKTDPVPITWHSIKGVREKAYPQIVRALVQDVKDLNARTIETNSSYFFGKLVARAARLALIAEEVDYPNVIPKIKKYLKETIEPWLDGTFGSNGFLYEETWGGLVTKQGSNSSTLDFGFGVYNDHHFHIGYFLYGIAVLTKIDPVWGRKYRPQAYSLMLDFMTLDKGSNLKYTRLRCFDLWKLHSWASGLTEFPNGRNQESTSEAVNAYYSAALMGLAYGDTHLVTLGSLLTAMEIHASQTWWHVKEDDTKYGKDFTRENRVVGILWSIKRDSGLWFAPPEWREARTGIQVLPLLPITEVLFSDVTFAKQLVEWTLPAFKRKGGVGEGWKGFVYALQGIYDNKAALQKIRSLTGHDDGNSLSNLLWWIFSRGSCEDGGGRRC
ncbi:Glycoside hydrolase, family 81 [Artemisia annua]|uniref:glucan endo-1,3-beta-D-glucosidase n=1 Tax=Artemisia annua TaxID=35608 RepID=A0A2U1QN44_ARTAN|nr:Glycoside hydrolase, family 81 [Artemisia annua]